jgi:hypothetical protein
LALRTHTPWPEIGHGQIQTKENQKPTVLAWIFGLVTIKPVKPEPLHGGSVI